MGIDRNTMFLNIPSKTNTSKNIDYLWKS